MAAAEARTQVWEELWEAKEKKRKKKKSSLVGHREVLSNYSTKSTADTDLGYSCDPEPDQQAESEDSGEASLISLTEVTEIVKKQEARCDLDLPWRC